MVKQGDGCWVMDKDGKRIPGVIGADRIPEPVKKPDTKKDK